MILDTIIKPKRFFDVNNKKDLKEAKIFFEQHRWTAGCPFILEYPYLTIPDMIRDKMIFKAFNIKYDRKHHWYTND